MIDILHIQQTVEDLYRDTGVVAFEARPTIVPLGELLAQTNLIWTEVLGLSQRTAIQLLLERSGGPSIIPLVNHMRICDRGPPNC